MSSVNKFQPWLLDSVWQECQLQVLRFLSIYKFRSHKAAFASASRNDKMIGDWSAGAVHCTYRRWVRREGQSGRRVVKRVKISANDLSDNRWSVVRWRAVDDGWRASILSSTSSAAVADCRLDYRSTMACDIQTYSTARGFWRNKQNQRGW